MHKNIFRLCGFTMVMGIFGAFLRWVQLGRAVEEDTGLFIAGSSWSWIMAAFLALVAAALVFLVRANKAPGFPETYPAVYAGGGHAAKGLAVLAGMLLALGGTLTIVYAMHTAATAPAGLNGTTDYTPVFDLALGLFAVVCGIAAPSFIISASKPKPDKGYGKATILVLFLCFWLIAAYKYSADDPVVWNYAVRLLAVAATILAFYYAAGFVFEKPRPLSALYFCQLSAFLCIVTLADSYPAGEQMIVFAFILLTTLLSALQLGNAGANPSKNDGQSTGASSHKAEKQ